MFPVQAQWAWPQQNGPPSRPGNPRTMDGDPTMNAIANNAVVNNTGRMLITREEDIYHASRALKAMAHPLRLQILCILGAHAEVSVQDIVEQVGTSQSNISQHLSILRDKGILASRKHANKVYYRIGDTRIIDLIESMRAAFCTAVDSV